MQLDDNDLSAICAMLATARRTRPQPMSPKKRRWSQCQLNKLLLAAGTGGGTGPVTAVGDWIFLDNDGYNWLDGNAAEFLT